MKLFNAVTPQPGESLPGLIARAAAENVYWRTGNIVSLTGLGPYRPEFIAMRDPAILPVLAGLLGAKAEDLSPMFHRPDTTHIDFFGVRIRAVHREPALRQMAPAALRKSEYHRAIWQIRPFSFDPETRQRLISACPQCHASLGFVIAHGISCCEHCLVPDEDGIPVPVMDLRDYPGEEVAVTDDVALDFVTGLVDPKPEVRARPLPRLHADLRDLDRGELFETVLAIASAVTLNADPDYVPSQAIGYRSGLRALPVAALEAAGRSLLSWPNAFRRLMTDAHGTASSRSREWRRLGDMGAIHNLSADVYLSAAARGALAAAISKHETSRYMPGGKVPQRARRNEDVYIGAKVLRNIARISHANVKALLDHPDVFSMRDGPAHAPAVLLRSEVAYILDRYKTMVLDEKIAWSMGLPVEALRDLEALGYLEREEGVPLDLAAPGVYYAGTFAEDMETIARENIPLRPKPAGYVKFAQAMLMFPAGRKPWAAVMEDIWKGRLDVVFHKPPSDKAMLNAVSVRGMETARLDLMERCRALPVPDIATVTVGNAHMMLGMYDYLSHLALVEAGIFRLDADGRMAYAHVIDVAGRYIFANEAGVRSGRVTGHVRGWLAANGVQPAHDLEVKSGLLYHRDQVEPLLAMR